MRHFILFTIAFCMALHFKAQRINTYTGKLHTFKLHVDSSAAGNNNYNCHVSLILVYDKSSGSLVQTITPPENSAFCTTQANQLFQVQDINFDGIKDLMLVQFIPAGPNIPYYYWKFNPKAKQFQRDTTLEDITAPNFDQDRKTVTSFWRTSATSHGVSTYKYIKNEITLVEEAESSPDPENDNQQIFTRKKLINGELKQVERTFDKVDKPAKK